MSKGELVPDELLITIIRGRLSKPDCSRGFLLDGYPRTVPQADALQMILTELNRNLDVVLNIDVDDEELIKRLSGRRVCASCGTSYHVIFNPPEDNGICDICKGVLYQREDDMPDAIRNRLIIYKKQTEPLIEYYDKKSLLQVIDGGKDIQQIFEDIKKVLNRYD